MVRASAADGFIRAFAITSREMAEAARLAHGTSPVVTAALGRLLSGAAMMGAMMKGEKDLLTVQIRCDGPVGGLLATADSGGRVKGYPTVADVDLPLQPSGKLDVGGAVGRGVLSVVRDMGMKDPYVGQVPLQTGEIAEDLTYYFAASEQVPSAVGLGVLVDRDCSVRRSGGFIVQLMPDTPDEVVRRLEERVQQIDSVTKMLEDGNSPEGILSLILGDMGLFVTDSIEAGFRCDCSRERVSRAIATLPKKDLDELSRDGEPVEVKCQFCNKAYRFTPSDIKEIAGRGGSCVGGSGEEGA